MASGDHHKADLSGAKGWNMMIDLSRDSALPLASLENGEHQGLPRACRGLIVTKQGCLVVYLKIQFRVWSVTVRPFLSPGSFLVVCPDEAVIKY